MPCVAVFGVSHLTRSAHVPFITTVVRVSQMTRPVTMVLVIMIRMSFIMMAVKRNFETLKSSLSLHLVQCRPGGCRLE